MMARQILLPSLLAATLVFAACDTGVAPDDGRLGPEDARQLAAELDALGSAALDDLFGAGGPSFSLSPGGGPSASTAPVPINVTFTRTRACPAGGQVTIAGTTTGEGDRETRSLTTTTVATKTHASCSVARRNGTSITINGNPNIVLEAHRKRVDGKPSGLQTQSQKGGYTWARSDGRSGSCEIDIASTFDPATNTRTIKGTNCGRTIDISRTR